MKVEQKVLTIAVDGKWNDTIAQLERDGWVILPGALATLPVARTLKEDGTIYRAAAESADLLGSRVGVQVNDEEVYTLRNGQLIDSDGKVVTEEERHRRWQTSEKRRQDYASKKIAETNGGVQ